MIVDDFGFEEAEMMRQIFSRGKIYPTDIDSYNSDTKGQSKPKGIEP